MQRKSDQAWVWFALSVVGLVLGASQGRAQSPPRFGHVFIVVEENNGYSDVVGDPSMPYLNSLIRKYGLATAYTADTHPSIDNYFMLTVGAIEANNDDTWNCNTTTGVISDDNIARELINADKSWKVYAEGIPSTGYTGCDSGRYVKHHNPFAFFNDVANDPTQANNMVDFTNNFARDLARHKLPDYSFIAPNLDHDAHDGTLNQADVWLQLNIAPLIQSRLFQKDGLLIVVFDEDGNTVNPGCTGSGNNCGGRVACVIISPKMAAAGFPSANSYHHENVLRLMAEGLGLTTFPGRAATAADMSEFFTSGRPAISLSPESLDFERQQMVTTSAAQSVTLSNTGDGVLFLTSVGASGDFAQTNTCGGWVAAGASCTINVTFTPTASGKRCGKVAITGSMSGGAKTVRLKGKGRAAETTADYYVSAAGSDTSGDGSAANPWATIAHADAQVSPGSTVHVAPGTYTGSFSTNTSGTPEARIRFVSDVKWGAKLVGTLESTWSSYGDYVDIVGFDVTGPGLNGIFAGGNFARVIGTHVHDITVACTGIGGSGINFPATNGDALGNYVHDIGPYPTPCNFTHGIYFLNAGGHAYNNIVFRAAGWGIQLWHSASGIVVANNTLFDNLHGGVIVGADAVIDDNTIVNNNIVFNNARGIFEEGTTGTHNVYQNNLIFQNSLADLSLQNGNTAADTVSADPQFVNFSGDPTGDYHLQSTSPAIDAGTSNAAPVRDYDGVARPQGNAWTIGAFEVVAPDQDDRDHGRRRSCSGERGGRCEHSPRGVGHSKHDDDDD